MSLYYFRGSKDIFKEIQDYSEQITVIKKILSENMLSNNLCFLLGSGCSVPAIETMGKTFKNIKNSIVKEFDKEELLGQFKESDNIEGYLNWLKKGVDFYSEKGVENEGLEYERVFNYVKEELIESIKVDYEDEDNKETLETLETYIGLYNFIFSLRKYQTNQPVNIFTTNYDLFNEVALERIGIQYTNGFSGYINREFDPNVFNFRLVDEENKYKDKWAPVRNFVRLYKVHGSIDWIYKEGKKIIQNNNPEACDIKSAIVYPTLDKHFDSLQSPYSELFREMNISLQKKNTTLIILGYGFGDSHINNLITQNLKDPDFNLIILNSYKGNPKMFFENNKFENVHFIFGDLSEDKGKVHYLSNMVELVTKVVGVENHE